MGYKHQTTCYRIIAGIRFENFADLIYSPDECITVVKQAKEQYKKVRQIKHPDGYVQLFVAEKR